MNNTALNCLIIKLNNYSTEIIPNINNELLEHFKNKAPKLDTFNYLKSEDLTKMFIAVVYNFYYDFVNNNFITKEYHYSVDFILTYINTKLFKWYNKNVIHLHFDPTPVFISSFPSNIPIIFVSKEVPIIERLYLRIEDYSKKLLKLYFDQSVDLDDYTRTKHIEVLEMQINKLFYQLYGLTDDEIAIIENDFDQTESII